MCDNIGDQFVEEESERFYPIEINDLIAEMY